MRVCLVSSLNLSGYYSRNCELALLSPPLGLLSLAAVLEQGGHEVALVDFNYALAEGEITLGRDFYARAAGRIEGLSPQVVGFSTMCNSYHIGLRIARAVKARLRNVPIVLGGPQASVVDRETLRAFPFVDMVLRGEAEETLPRLAADLAQGRNPEAVPGLTYRRGGLIVRNADAPLVLNLDSLPPPAYHLFPYGAGTAPAIDAGRGCPFPCSFRSTSTFWRCRFRLKSIDTIIQEMWTLKRTHNAPRFTFAQDLFTVSRRRLQAFCDRLQAEKMDVTWTCSARIDRVDASLLRHMSDAGCRALFYGVETGSPAMQRQIHKNLRLEKVSAAVGATIEAKMKPTLSFAAGYPGETEEDLRQTLDMIQELLARPQADVQLHILAPQAGPPDYERYRDRLRFDGHYSGVAGTARQFLQPKWFRRYPELFSCFHYFETDGIPRERLKGLDLFVQGPCSAMRGTVLRLLAGGRSLWDLYCDWREWADPRGLGGGPTTDEAPDEYLLDFYDFAAAQVATHRADFDLGRSRDEILAFYLQYYGRGPLRFISSEDRQGLPGAEQTPLK